MSEKPVRQFRSNGHRGFSDVLSADPRHVFARKVVHTIQVEFATAACTVQTSEGIVHAKPGDAILTGTAGSVGASRASTFRDKYQPVARRRGGRGGFLPALARIGSSRCRMTEPFEVMLADGVRG